MNKEESKMSDDNQDNQKPRSEFQILVQIIEAFKENALIQKENSSAQKEHYKRQEENERKDKKLGRRVSLAIAFTTLCGVMITASVGLYVSAKQSAIQRQFQLEQERHAQAGEQGQELETKIRDEITKRDALNSAISNLRNIRESNLIYCENGQFTGNKSEYEIKYVDGIYQFVNAWYALSGIFSNDIQKEARDFLMLVDSNKEICNKNNPQPIMLQLMHRQLNENINKFINLDQEKRSSLLSKEGITT